MDVLKPLRSQEEEPEGGEELEKDDQAPGGEEG